MVETPKNEDINKYSRELSDNCKYVFNFIFKNKEPRVVV